ncbi:non-ribosomal peptide synthetase [Streptomyces nanshensis]|uniref:Phenyloxazoline synthase MbtB n=1 Tax=Streptomyces nanshensis TaxID=518642 RepID=A0A1E7LA07_9ACTN|nr:non-ribosomal peptide synthetase [Streptomyces nanshensis]OEV12823.1 non-ribosomal peptide synthetase [Streptomyces nanshensis]
MSQEHAAQTANAHPRLDLRGAVAEALGIAAEDIHEETPLIQLGLDSLTMMRLAGTCRRAGLDVGFAELIAEPTLAAWNRLVADRQGDGEAAAAGDSDEREFDAAAPFDLALMQHAYWVGRSREQRLGGVAAHFYHEFDGTNVEPGRLESAVRTLLARHGMLRVSILDDGRQRILPTSPWPGLRIHDLRGLDPHEARRRLETLRRELSHRHMDISAGEVFDVQLSLLPDALRHGGTRLHVNLDMIAADALSLRVLLHDLAAAYADPATPLPALDYSYPRYLAEREAARTAPARAAVREADRQYWQERLPELPVAPRLPAAAEYDGTAVGRVVRRHRHLEAERTRRLEQAARDHGLTPAMALAAVFAETLEAFSAEPEFLLNLPLFDREPLHDHVTSLVGDFTSSVLLAWHGRQHGTFAERATRLQEQFHQDVAHAGYSGVEVLRDASRLRGEQVLAPVVYTSALGLGELFADTVRESFGEPSWIISQGPQVWLDAQVTEVAGGLLINWDAREDAFAPGVLDAMFDAYTGLLDRLLAGPDAWSAPVPALLPEEQLRLREKADDGWQPPEARLHDAFFAHAAEDPEALALVGEHGLSMTYGELAERALRVAGHLRSSGVAPGDLVALTLPKGTDQIVAVLGILAAGAAYLPLGVDQPAARRDRILAAAGTRLVLDDLSVCRNAEPLPAPVPGDASDLAYVIHTSGSTGEPKGVEITHKAALNTVADLNDRFVVGGSDRLLALSALDFDLSVYDVFGSLTAGGALVCVEEAARRDAVAWAELARIHRVTVVNCVPALLDMLITAAGPEGLPDLRLTLLGGDWIPLDLPGRVRGAAPDCRFVALGGTTETAIHSTLCEVERVPAAWTSVPYGTPLRGVGCRAVDPHGRDRPDWVPGELWIGGAGVARGYRGDEARTAEKFTAVDGTDWYRTGDLVRYWPDGTLEFLGRADQQVKIRGHRVELGEIEAVLAAAPGVERAVAVVDEDGRLGVAVTGVADPAQVRAHAAGQLPAAMVPERCLVTAEFPLTSNGKTDRGAVRRLLTQCDARSEVRAVTPPRGEREQQVADVWSSVLHLDGIGRENDFFALGGDSLLATRMIARLRGDGHGGVQLSELFAAPVLADFAALLTPDGRRPAPRPLISDPESRHEPFPLTDVQRAYWLGRGEDFTLGGIGCHFYREYDVEDLDVERLEAALDRLVARHEMLRAVVDDSGEQRVLPQVPRFHVEIEEAGPDMEAACTRLRDTASHQVFDPGTWPLFAVRGVRSGAQTRIGIGIDNIALDALSILVFYAELSALYTDPEAELPPVEVSFRDYVHTCGPDPETAAAARDYWSEQLDRLPPPPALPLAKDPSEVARPRFVRHAAHIAPERWQALTGRARDAGLTPSGVLLTAFAEVLGRWSARPELTLNLTLFDRRDVHPDIGNVLGDFTSLMLVSSRPRAEESWLARARRVQRELWRSLDHREVSAVWVLRELARRTGTPETTMPVVFTSALGLGGDSPGAPFERDVWGISQTPQVWLDHQVTEDADGVHLNWDVVEELFPDGFVEAMFAAYTRLLEWLAEHDWNEPVPDLLPDAQRAVRTGVNDTGDGVPGLLHRDFFCRAAEQPDRTALLWGEDGRMSYGELAHRALRLAAVLSEHGVARGEPVAVSMPKGSEQITAVLGVLAAGAAYVPVGVDQPPARQERIHRTAGTRLVVTGSADAAPSGSGPSTPDGIRRLSVDAVPSGGAADGPVDVPVDALAYVIFTSGSTGDPKGVEITHRAAANTVTDINQRYGVGERDRVLAVSALDFDLSVYDIFGLLSAGGALVLIDEEDRRDARRWLDLVRQHRVTVWNTVPALLDMLLVVAEAAQPADSLELALVSGDWVGLDLPGRLADQSPWARFVALGGATEAAIWSNAFEVAEVVRDWPSIPYGHPLRGQRYRVVDTHGRDCPDRVPGELWIGGAGLARGYRGAPELTEERFVEDRGERWYRTGDLGRYWPDGTLEFLGRADQQVKIRGHRIELGEIEAALLETPGVGHSVVTVAGDGASRRLVAAVVPAAAPASDPVSDPVKQGQPPSSTEEFRRRARERESAVAESFLARLLHLDDLSGQESLTVAQWAGRVRAAEPHLPVLRLWLKWLAERKVLLATPTGYAPGPEAGAALVGRLLEQHDAYGELLAQAQRRLTDRLGDFREILAGRLDPSVLLDDDILAPSRLSAADPGTATAIDDVAAIVADSTAGADRPLELAVLGSQPGAVGRLLEDLTQDQVRCTLLDNDPDQVEKAARSFTGSAHEVACRRLPGLAVPEELRHRFDAVVLDHVLHRSPEPSRGPALAALLTRPGGLLVAVERSELTPVALLTAGLLDGGYAAFDRERRTAGTPTLAAARWAGLLSAAGYRNFTHRPVHTSFTEVLTARRSPHAADLDPTSLRDHAAAYLPAHMLPDRITVLPWLPLGANGKVDRSAVAAAAGLGQSDTPDEPPQGELEEAVAGIWCELLDVAAVGRRQNFFALGGDSLLATRFLTRLAQRFGVRLPLRRMFQGPTPEQIAQTLSRELDAHQGSLEETEEGVL